MKNNKYTVVIIDNNDLCIDILRSSLAEYTELLVVGKAKTSLKGKALIREHRPELLFIDVELSGQSGLELLNEISGEITWPLHVVFYTACEKYLLDALRVSAFDYLLKPCEQEEIRIIVQRFLNHIVEEQTRSSFHNSLSQLNRSDHTYLIATITGYKKLSLEQIGYFEYHKKEKQWTVVLNDQSRLLLRHNTNAEDIVKHSSTFIQINQSHIINFDYLSNIDDKICQLLPPFHKENSLIISRTFLKVLQEKFEMI